MSEEMAVSDNATGDDATMPSDELTVESVPEMAGATPEQPPDVLVQEPEETPPLTEGAPQLDIIKKEPQDTNVTEEKVLEADVKAEPMDSEVDLTEVKVEIEEPMSGPEEKDEKRGIKRRASDAFSDDDDVEFKGFVDIKMDDVTVEYSQIVERLEAEVTAAAKGFTPVRQVMATPAAPGRANKRPRKDTGTDGSRPSSALSSRSDGDDNPSASPAHRGRRATTEMSSPLLRVPLERGWKRELVFRAALDAYSRRNADIYYYTPQGKKLRSTREISENLSGTGLTLENFSFFKEPLGVDDPEKEIIRDAKVMRRVDSPVAAPPVVAEGKRTPKPKPPKGASPEPSTPKSPPTKLKVKSVGSRLSNAAPAPTPPKSAQKKPSPSPAPAAAPDNNNSAAWKKPSSLRARLPGASQPSPAASPPPQAVGSAALAVAQIVGLPVAAVAAAVGPPAAPASQPALPPAARAPSPPPRRLQTPPPLVSKPQPQEQLSSPDLQSPRRVLQPCGMTCGAGVPSLSCAACLCMYHPTCAGYSYNVPRDRFLCKNCRKSSSPPHDPPPLTQKPGASSSSTATMAVPTPRRVAVPNKLNSDKRVLLRMKVSGSTDGERVWSVANPRPPAAPRAPPPPPPRALILPAALPQSLAVINGKRFIVVPRPAPLPPPPNTTAAQHEDRRRGRAGATNGTAPPAALASPRGRRGRPKADDTDHFTAFYNRAQQGKSNIVVQIFQYLGMRDLAHCARVCRLWRGLAATPILWRHVRMKNSHVSDWGGLCAALKRHGTKWLDLRKMLLPQNDTAFWKEFTQHVATVDTLERLEMCRCPAGAVEAAARVLPGLRALAALAVRDAALDPAPLACATQLRELRLKSLAGLSLTADLTALSALQHLQHLSLTSIKELGWRACDVIGELPNLESLELGECTFRAEFAQVLSRLKRLKRLRLERGTAHCAAPAILRALAQLPCLTRLELVNIDVKVGFDDALAECKNIQRLLIIPTYVSQSATTNKQVLSGILRLKDTLTHLMWGVTFELLRVTELFIDQCSAGGARRELGECIPVLKPVPGCRLPMDHQLVAGPPQVEILPLPTLQRLLSAQLPNTKLKLLRIPFHATWRQSLADFQ